MQHDPTEEDREPASQDRKNRENKYDHRNILRMLLLNDIQTNTNLYINYGEAQS